MNILEFISGSPWISFFLALVIGEVLKSVLYLLPKRMIRSADIRTNGWPPAHCDADGDFKQDTENNS